MGLGVELGTFHELLVDKELEVHVEAVDEGALFGAVAEAFGQAGGTHVEVDGEASAVHEGHVVKKAGGTSATTDELVAGEDGHFVECYTFFFTKVLLTMLLEDVPDLHAQFLFDVGI